MSKNALFIAATGQNVGKTTLCLGMIAAFKKRFEDVGFIKPVGQQHVRIEKGLMVDKDVVLFREHFNLTSPWEEMSPVIIPSGFTKKALDGSIDLNPLKEKIVSAFQKIVSKHTFTIVEGTGHVGVGSIIDLNNANVAKLLDLEVVIIAPAGLGSTFDDLTLNINLCHQLGVTVRGVILNRVYEDKRKMILNYFPKALKKWDIPLIGCIPYNDFLINPTIKDFEALFHTQLLSGHKHHYRHFQHTRLVAGSTESYIKEMIPNELIITPASREDIILATLDRHQEWWEQKEKDYQGGMILTGRQQPSQSLLKEIRKVDIPVLYAPMESYMAMKMITSYIAKIRQHDLPKIEQAISTVEKHLDFDQILK